MLRLFFCSLVFLSTVFAHAIDTKHHNEIPECEDNVRSLDPEDLFLKKYVMLVLKLLNKKAKTDLKLLAIENASFQISDGVLFNFTLQLVDTSKELSAKTCNAIVHQGTNVEEINITEVTCKTEKIPECSYCEVFIQPDDPILRKYINITLEELFRRNELPVHLLEVRNASYHAIDGILYKFVIIVSYGNQQKEIEKCDVTVHQGYSLEAINVTKLQCVKSKQIHESTECLHCEVILDPDDPILGKYVNITLEELRKNGAFVHLVRVMNASYQVSDGMLYKFTIIVAYGDQQKDIQSCEVAIHQGYAKDAITIIRLHCVKNEQIEYCKECIISLDPDDPVLQKYVNVSSKVIEHNTGHEVIVIGVKDPKYQVVDGILYTFTLHLIANNPNMEFQACEVGVHQGYGINDINVTRLVCTKAQPPCTVCGVHIHHLDSSLPTYIRVAMQKIREKLGSNIKSHLVRFATKTELQDGKFHRLILQVGDPKSIQTRHNCHVGLLETSKTKIFLGPHCKKLKKATKQRHRHS